MTQRLRLMGKLILTWHDGLGVCTSCLQVIAVFAVPGEVW